MTETADTLRVPMAPPADEWFEMLRGLESHHALFAKLYEMGRPVFDDSISTACVVFDEAGNQIEFRWNREFWDRCTPYERNFVNCHEALHVVGAHGLRIPLLPESDDQPSREETEMANVAADIAINHILVEGFGFRRELISFANTLCWVDTVFADDKGMTNTWVARHISDIPTNRAMEYYYALLNTQVRSESSDGSLRGTRGQAKDSFDDHSNLPGTESVQSRVDEILENIASELSDEEMKDFIESARRELDAVENRDTDQGRAHGGLAGTGPGSWRLRGFGVRRTRKKKWETVIKKWSMKYIRTDQTDVEQWAIIPRRMVALDPTLMIPHDLDDDHNLFKEERILVFFFLDTSGSCISLAPRFFNAAASLPTEKFDIRLFCFDTKVVETTLESEKVYGGGGTYFNIMESKIQQILSAEKIPYPKAVFVITDGYGNKVVPAHPETWHWFLTGNTSRNTQYVPTESQSYNLQDFE